jgi:hypothetical protein
MKQLQKTLTYSIVFAVCSAINLLAQAPATIAVQTTINGRPLSERQRIEFQLIYGTPPSAGNFWYDARSGMWGYWGREVAGVLNPGHNYGPLSPDASNGKTGVFINGRQLNAVEVMFFQHLVSGPIQRVRAWLDGMTGNFGIEGSPMPLGNLASMVNANQPRQPLYSANDLVGGFSNSAGTCTKAGNCYYSGR